MNDILVQMSRVRGVGGSLLLSADGLAIVSHLRDNIDENSLGAAIAEALARTEQLRNHLGLGQANTFHIAASDGSGLLVLAVGPSQLAVLVDPGANLALLQLEVRPHVQALAERLAL